MRPFLNGSSNLALTALPLFQSCDATGRTRTCELKPLPNPQPVATRNLETPDRFTTKSNPKWCACVRGVRGVVTGCGGGNRTHDPWLMRPVRHHASSPRKLARQKGFEPLTYCLEGSCSIQLSYWRISFRMNYFKLLPRSFSLYIISNHYRFVNTFFQLFFKIFNFYFTIP